jgi:transforming growth factor-beta-induced protein
MTVVPTTSITAAPATTTIIPVPTKTTITPVPNATQKSIVDTLAADGRFTTLVAALRATQLDSNLSAPGPFTLFAPTDSAFDKLPAGTMDSYLKDPQTYYLTKTLRYHMVNKKLMASDIMRVASIDTIQGQSILINVAGGTIYVNGNGKIISTDIVCSNGVIQVVDTVMTPHD